jgi:hypothetical protein
MSYRKRPIESTDLLQDDSGALVVRGGMEGKGKPDLLCWDTGSDTYADPQTGNVNHDSGVVFIRVAAGGALVSIDDETDSEKPFIIPPNYWREIVIPGGITAGSRIVAKNLTSGVNFRELAVEVR